MHKAQTPTVIIVKTRGTIIIEQTSVIKWPAALDTAIANPILEHIQRINNNTIPANPHNVYAKYLYS